MFVYIDTDIIVDLDDIVCIRTRNNTNAKTEVITRSGKTIVLQRSLATIIKRIKDSYGLPGNNKEE